MFLANHLFHAVMHIAGLQKQRCHCSQFWSPLSWRDNIFFSLLSCCCLISHRFSMSAVSVLSRDALWYCRILVSTPVQVKGWASGLYCAALTGTFFTVFGWYTAGLFQLVSAYSLSQNTIESSRTIQISLCCAPAEHSQFNEWSTMT